MRKSLLPLIVCVLLSVIVKAQYVNIPDSNFRKYLITQIPACLNETGQLDTTCTGVDTLKTISCGFDRISDLTGISYFKNLDTLNCNNNLLTTLPTLPNGIRVIYATYNQFTSLPTLPYSLHVLLCGNSKLTSLPSLPANLSYLSCEYNQLTSLPQLPDSVGILLCQNNQLTSIPNIPNSIGIFTCDNNQLTSLPAFPATDSTKGHTFFFSAMGNKNLTCLPKLPNNFRAVHLDSTGINCLPNALDSATITPDGLSVCSGGSPCALSNYVNIPDSNFRKYLIKTVPACFNKAGQMDTTCSGVLNQQALACSDSIKDVTGVQYFKNAIQLFFSFNQIKRLPTLPNGLTYLWCSFNQIDSLPTLPNTLQDLEVDHNNLTSIPSLPSNLTTFWCNNNRLTVLPQLPNNITAIQCGNNLLTNLPTLPSTLSDFDCSNNQITNMPGLPNTLVLFGCSNNQLTSLPALPNTVTWLDFSNNLFTSFPTLPNSIQSLNCSYNLFNCLPKLPTSLQTLNILRTGIQCLPNATSATVTPSGLPICNNPCTISDDYSNYVNIPDSNFRKYLTGAVPACINKVGQMDTTCNSVLNDTMILCGNIDTARKIKDLTGIQYFKSLRYLELSSNKLETLPKLSDSVSFLQCSYNNLSSLPALPSNLFTLYCSFNQLNTMPALPQKLTYLFCDNNKLQSLPPLPDALYEFYCNNNQLTNLPNLPKALFNIACENNQLTGLPSLPSSLVALGCGNNKIISLPSSLPKKLNSLSVDHNPIAILPTLDSLNNLQQLSCKGDTNLLCLPKLPNSLLNLILDSSGIQCLPNYINSTVLVTPSNLPICNPTNNAHQCSAYPTVLGRVFGDNNSNGIKDSNEFYIPYIPVHLNTNEISYSNDSGQYAVSTKDTGSFSLSVTAPPFYKSVPAKFNFSFGEFNDVLTLNDIALQPTVQKDSLGIYIYPWQNAIPGRSMAYALEYRNYGTVNENTTISFTYDTSKLIFDTASVALISHTGNTLIWKDTLMADYFGNDYYRNGFRYPNLYFKVKTNAVMGTAVKCSATIVSTKASASTTDSTTIMGSYDPNSKKATPKLTTTQVANGNGIDYLIHFQNVGNATASNVVIADTLSNLLNQGVMQLIGTSHDASVIIENGIIYFQFFNINLADSSTNQLKSNGFVHFRLNPLTTLKSGASIDNKASIYFDYNKPVVTNTANTLISNVTLPVSIINFQAKQTNGMSIMTEWVTLKEVNTAYFNVQRSMNGTDFTTIGKLSAKGGTVNSYQFVDNTASSGVHFYRLQMVDKSGAVTYSKVVSAEIVDNRDEIVVVPNPVKSAATIKGNHIALVQVIDNIGRVVKTVTLKDATNPVLSVNGLPAGIYHLRIQTTDGNVSGVGMVKE